MTHGLICKVVAKLATTIFHFSSVGVMVYPPWSGRMYYNFLNIINIVMWVNSVITIDILTNNNYCLLDIKWHNQYMAYGYLVVDEYFWPGSVYIYVAVGSRFY